LTIDEIKGRRDEELSARKEGMNMEINEVGTKDRSPQGLVIAEVIEQFPLGTPVAIV
jgi:hypothetical protein